jgi:hypothetical protein
MEIQVIQQKIYEIRGRKVMLDHDFTLSSDEIKELSRS